MCVCVSVRVCVLPERIRAMPPVRTLLLLVPLAKALRPRTTPAKQLSTASSMKARVASQKAETQRRHRGHALTIGQTQRPTNADHCPSRVCVCVCVLYTYHLPSCVCVCVWCVCRTLITILSMYVCVV